MIITYGAFVSKSLSPQYVTYFCKYAELYTLTYELDTILDVLGKKLNGLKSIRQSGKGLISEFEILDEQKIGTYPVVSDATKAANATARERDRADRQPPSGAKTSGTRDKPITTNLDQGHGRDVSPEPTWVKVTVNGQTRMFGVKVVPIYIKNDAEVLKALLDDTSHQKWLTMLLKVLNRQVKAFLINVWARIKSLIPLLGRDAPTGGKMTVSDIIYMQSIYRDRLFLCLNYADIANSSLFDDPNTIRNLQLYMRWCSFVFVDQINQIYHFCMREFHGSCAQVHYHNLVASIGKTHYSAAQDISDIQSTANSVFRKKSQKINKMFSEILAVRNILDTRNHMNISMLKEDAVLYLRKPELAVRSYERLLQLKRANRKKVENQLMSMPTISDKQFYDYVRIKFQKYQYLEDFCRRVIVNSVKWDDPISDEIAIKIIAFKNKRATTLSGKREIPNTVEMLKTFVKKAREEYKITKDSQLSCFRALLFAFTKHSSFSNYANMDNEQRREVIQDNMYIFLGLIPRIFQDATDEMGGEE